MKVDGGIRVKRISMKRKMGFEINDIPYPLLAKCMFEEIVDVKVNFVDGVRKRG